MLQRSLFVALAVALVPIPALAGAGVIQDMSDSFINGPGQGVGGADASILQTTSLGMTTIGFGSNTAVGVNLADDVTFLTDVDIDTITVYSYQTGSTTTPTHNGLFIQIWDGQPGLPTSNIIAGNIATNVFGGAVFIDAYRVTETTLTNNTRPIMAVTSTDLGIELDAGTYWIQFGLTGTLASGPWIPPVTITGVASPPGSNAVQLNAGAWAAAVDGGTGLPAQTIPLTITGTSGPLADVAVTIDDGQTAAITGATATYVATITNTGPDGVAGVLVDTVSTNLTAGAWTCAVIANASCPTPPSGTGDLTNVSVDLGLNGSVAFALDATVSGAIGNTASRAVQAEMPAGTVDPDAGDQTDSDDAPIVADGVFGNGFE